MKKLRRQQEAALSEVVSQKEELVRWVAEEKARTLKWCEEQQQAATRERNAAAKMARESRQKALSGTVPIRCVAVHLLRAFFATEEVSLSCSQLLMCDVCGAEQERES